MKEPLEIIDVPHKVMDLAKRRTKAILLSRVLTTSALDIAANCYLQGLEDGYEAGQRAAADAPEDHHV